MNTTLPILTDEEVRRCVPEDEEVGFGTLATARGRLPLKALDVHAHLDGLLSEIELTQTFVNALAEPLEATYIFPLPDRAAVTRFRMEVGSRVIEGVLKERGDARREYQQALQAGHLAAITEEERPGVFTMRVGNLMPGEEATVRLTLVGPLPYSDGDATFRFPLVVAPRYIPGIPLLGPSVGAGVVQDTDAVPDASRITPPVLLPGFPNPVHLSLAVDVHPSELTPTAFRSSLHAILEEQQGGRRRFRLQAGERLDRDFILRFRLAEDALKTALSLKPDVDNNQSGTFLLTVVPPVDAARSERPRDIVFVLDRSGSMGGWKMVAARRALARMVDTLTDHDRFTVYAFDDAIETPPEFPDQGLLPASNRNRYRAVEFLARIDARGGTEMAQPLDRAVNQLAEDKESRDRILVLITDGQVGQEDQILRHLGKRLKTIRVFTLGIDRAVNAAFLQRLGTLGGGACELVESEDRLDEVMEQVHRRIATPVLTRLRLEPAGLSFIPDTVTPARLPDLFAGAPVSIMGRYQAAAQGSIALQATDATGKASLKTVRGNISANPALPAVWARNHIRELEDRYVLGHPELEKTIVTTSLQFGVLCRFTAFVAVDRSEVVNAGGQVHQLVQPVEVPQGWEAPSSAVACCSPSPPPGYYSAETVDSMFQLFVDEPTAAAPPRGSRHRASPPSAAKSGSIGRVFKSVIRKLRSAQPTALPSPLNLEPFRLQAGALAQEIRDLDRSHPARLKREMAALIRKLKQLVKQFKAEGVPESQFVGLTELLAKLDTLSLATASVEIHEQVRSTTEQVLQAFAGGVEAPRREEFWK